MGFIGTIITAFIVIQDIVTNNLTSEGYPKTEIIGVSVYSFENITLFITIFGFFLLTGDLVAMDS